MTRRRIAALASLVLAAVAARVDAAPGIKSSATRGAATTPTKATPLVVSASGTTATVSAASPLATLVPSTVPAVAPLTAAEVLGVIDQRHPLLDATVRERPIAEAELQSAQGAFDRAWRTRAVGVPMGGYPSARVDSSVEVPTTLWGTTFFGGYRWGSDTFADYDGKQETNPLGELRAGATVPLLRNGPVDRRRASIARASTGLELADLTIAERRIELCRLATVRYWDWVGAGRKLVLAREMLATAQNRDAGIASRVAAGDLPAFEHVDNQRAILQRRQQVVSAERALQQAALELSLFYRGADGAPIVVDAARLPVTMPAPEPINAPTRDDITRALTRRPEPARARAQGVQANVEREWAMDQRRPALDLSVAVSQDMGQSTYAVADKRAKTELEASLMLEIPIDRNVADGRVRVAQAQMERAQAQERFAADRVATELADAHSAITAALQRHGIAVDEVTLARRLEQGERDKFGLGDSSLLLVNLREQATVEAAVREVDAVIDYLRARALFDAAAGVHAQR